MKYVLRSLFFHMLSILIFTYVYYKFSNTFRNINGEYFRFLDCVFLSVNIQSGVGVVEIVPTGDVGKIMMIIQQLIMICGNVIIIYFLTL
jgi:hypothetical protein